MIIIFHFNEKALEAFDYKNNCIVNVNTSKTIQENLVEISLNFKDRFLGWCNIKLKDKINNKQLPNILLHKKLMISYSITNSYIINNDIGFVDSNDITIQWTCAYNSNAPALTTSNVPRKCSDTF